MIKLKSIISKIIASSIILIMSIAYANAQLTNIIPFGPGGESDVTARLQQKYYKEMFNEDMVIQYKPGGGGAVAWQTLNSEKNDGSVIMGANLPHIIMQPMANKEKAGYTTSDLNVFNFFHYTPDAILVEASSPHKTFKDLVAFAKKNPGKLTLSGSGTYSANHLLTIQLEKKAGIKTTYVPFKGTGAANQALLGKQVEGSAGYYTIGIQLGDKARVLAIASDKRLPAFPNVPTLKELGYDIVSGAYRGYALPKSTSTATKKKLSDRLMKINADKNFIKTMEDGGYVVVNIGHDQVDKFMAEQKKINESIAKSLGLIK